MRKIVTSFIIIIILIVSIFLFASNNRNQLVSTKQTNKEEISIALADQSATINPSLYVATDGLGRTLSTSVKKSSNHYRAVGVFYWTWHLAHSGGKAINVNNVSKVNPDKKNDWNWWSSNYATAPAYWWNESIYGYYLENDDYVLRKQAELLADAGVDFVVFDCTNGTYTWETAYHNLLRVWKEAKNQGVNVPRIAFMLQFAYDDKTYTSFMNIYNDLYKPGTSNYNNYSSLFYKYNEKPLILLNSSGAPADMKNILKNFEVRSVDASYFITGSQQNGKWGWLSTYPQAYYKKADGTPEQISVGVAQNANYETNQLTAMNGSHVMGRSYAKDNYSYSYTYKNQTITVGSSIIGPTAKSTNTSLYGRNFQQQWDYAISIDPEIVFVTGWNEWIMGNYEKWQGVSNAFPDQFNDEYSRDIEPTKGELKDHYYYQLVENIRKYKGVTAQSSQTAKTINSTSDWNNSNILSYNHYVGGYNRNIDSSGKVQKYVNNTFRNDIKKAKVSYDASYIYFYVETVNKLTSYNSGNWMKLLIDTKKNNNDNWEEFEYIVNRTTGTSSKLVLEKSNGGWNFSKVGDVTYKVTNNVLEITIPRRYLGLTSNSVSINFKWCDNNIGTGDIMSVYTDGDAAPGGRFAFHLEGTAAYKQEATETPVPTILPTVAPTISPIIGDVNLDDKVNALDYVVIKKYILNNQNLSQNAKYAADMNSDGNINAKDYVILRKKILSS